MRHLPPEGGDPIYDHIGLGQICVTADAGPDADHQPGPGGWVDLVLAGIDIVLGR